MKIRKLGLILLAMGTGAISGVMAAELELGDPRISPDPDIPSSLAVQLKGADQIVGVQFDLVYQGNFASPGLPVLPESDTDHTLEVRLLEEGRYRALLSSPRNRILPTGLSVQLRFGFTSLSPEGGPAMVLENIILVTAGGQQIPATAAYGPISTWRNTYFTEEQWSNPIIGGDRGNLDGDSANNLKEYLLGTRPDRWELQGAALPRTFLRSAPQGDGKLLVLSWKEAKSAVGVRAVVAGGTHPSALSARVTPQMVGEDSTHRHMEAAASIGDQDAYFLELRIERE